MDHWSFWFGLQNCFLDSQYSLSQEKSSKCLESWSSVLDKCSRTPTDLMNITNLLENLIWASSKWSFYPERPFWGSIVKGLSCLIRSLGSSSVASCFNFSRDSVLNCLVLHSLKWHVLCWRHLCPVPLESGDVYKCKRWGDEIPSGMYCNWWSQQEADLDSVNAVFPEKKSPVYVIVKALMFYSIVAATCESPKPSLAWTCCWHAFFF